MTMTMETKPAAKRPIDKKALLAKYIEERDKRLRPDGNAQYLQIERPALALPGRPLHAPSASARPRPTTSPSPSSAAASPAWSPARGWSRRASPTSASSRRAATSAAPGTGTATRARSATPPRWSTCRSWKRPGTCRPRSTRTRPEILEQCQRIGKQYGLYDNALFHTEVTDLAWDEATSPLGDPDQPRRPLHRPVHRPRHRPAARAEAAGHSGHRDLQGPLVPHQPLGLRLHRRRSERRAARQARRQAGRDHRHRRDRRAGACRTSPAPARRSTSSSARPPRSTCAPTSRSIPDWFASIATPGWQQRWLENFTANQAGGDGGGGPRQGRLDRPRRAASARRSPSCRARSCTPQKMLAAYEDSDFEKMEEIRARAEAIVRDRDTAEKLKAWYRQLCKRPCFHDEYLQAFNEPAARTWSTPTARASSGSPERLRGRRRRIRGRLHHLRLGLRGRHRVQAPRRLRGDGARRPDALRGLGRGHALASTASTCTASRTPSSCSRRRART